MTRRSIVLLLSILAALTLSTDVALAGTYQITACNAAPGAVNNSWIWSTNDTTEPTHYAEHENCPYRLGGTNITSDQEGGLSTTDALELHNGAPPGTSAAWAFTAAPGTSITAITYERYIGDELDPSNYWSPALRADGQIIPGETCTDSVSNDEDCFVGGPPGHGELPATITGLSAHKLALGIQCLAPTGQECITGAILHSVWAAMYGAIVTIEDPTPPTLNQPAGALWEPGENNGYHKGTETLTTSAQDLGGGVQNITLAVDGTPTATYTAQCDYTLPQPCPLSTGLQTLTLPTTTLPDGTHTLTLTATDAAGNQSTPLTTQITTENNPPPAPIGLTATPTQPGSTTFTATWADPPGQTAAITAATYQICPTIEPQACSPPAPAPPEGPATVTVPGPGAWTLAVWLTNQAGNTSPATAARIPLIPTTPSGATTSGASPSEGGGPHSGSPSEGSSNDGPPAPPPAKTPIHIAETRHGRKLIVRISGPATGTVRVSIIGRYHGKTIIRSTRTLTLKHGKLTTTFKLTARAAHATIRVNAQLTQPNAARVTDHKLLKGFSLAVREI